jgi:fatty acid desaturase
MESHFKKDSRRAYTFLHPPANEMGADEDVATDPFLFQWAPDPKQDSPLRKIQHLIFYIPFSFMFALWRFDSVKVAVDAVEKKRTGAKNELYSLMFHYLVLLSVFPLTVWVPAVFMSGLVSALIVTPTHQSEEMFEDYQSDWVTAQFQSTRNAVATNPFSEWIWGGMQYQLEHHLFPTMPRSKYPLLRERLIKFAEDNKIPGGYRESGEFEILKMNWDLYRKVAKMDAVEGAPPSRGRPGQQGAIESPNAPTKSFISAI